LGADTKKDVDARDKRGPDDPEDCAIASKKARPVLPGALFHSDA
jgi:hypothetical protein